MIKDAEAGRECDEEKAVDDEVEVHWKVGESKKIEGVKEVEEEERWRDIVDMV